MGDVDGSFKKASARVVAIASAVSTARVRTSGSREADKSWSLVGDGVKDSEIWEIDSVNTDDSSSEASPDQQDFESLD